jgi:hypothetical protein
MAQLATKYNLNEEYANAAKNLLTQTIEKAIAALWSSLSNTAVGDTTTVLSDAEILESIYTLDNLNFDLNECAFGKRAHNKPSYMLEHPVRSFVLMPAMA